MYWLSKVSRLFNSVKNATMLSIPKPLEDACFRALERFMIKAPHFIKGYSLKKGGNEEHALLGRPRMTGLETHYTVLLISTREYPFSSIKA